MELTGLVVGPLELLALPPLQRPAVQERPQAAPGLLLLPSQERMRAGTCEPGRRMCAARAPDLPMRPARALPRASCTCAASGARRGL